MKSQFIKSILIVCLLAVSALFFQNCGVGSFSTSEVYLSSLATPNTQTGNDSSSQADSSEKVDFKSFRFFVGGWFPGPNQPNWSDDINFVLQNNALSADSKTLDELCLKPTYTVEEADRKKILSLIAGLTIVVAKDLPAIADAGSKSLQFKLNDGSEKTVLLNEMGASNGDNVATNGAELVSFLQNLNKKIPIACKKAPTEDLLSFTYFNGGGYPAPGAPSWRNDIQFRVTSSGVFAKAKVQDSLCFKPEYKLSDAEASEIISAAFGLDIKTKADGAVVADAPTNKITLTLKSGEIKVVHLSSSSAATGELWATNGSALAQLLQALDQKIPMACH